MLLLRGVPKRVMSRWLRMLWMMKRVLVGRILCQVTRCLVLPLVPWLVASLRFLNLPSGQVHVWVSYPLLVQLFLGPEQHLEADSQLALCVVSMFSHENSCIELASNLLSMPWR